MSDQIARSMHSVECPKCKEKLVVGMSIVSPEIAFALKESDIRKKKDDLVEVIKGSSLSEGKKKDLLATYGKPDIVVDPEFAGNMIDQIKKEYAKV